MLREQAYEKFKECLFAEKLEPGQFVSQRELCEIVGVPLGPMRDALKRLEAESLVRLVAQRGIQIADVNLDLIKNTCELRLFLEKEAVRKFAKRAPQQRIARHHDAFCKILEKARRGPITAALLKRAFAADVAFHTDIIDHLANPMIADMHRATMDKIRLIRLKSQMTELRIVPVMTEHMLVTEALKRRDGDGAAAAMDAHLSMVQARASGIEIFLTGNDKGLLPVSEI
ncbi:MAG: GntR family transcriptional regulator [Alphaproteobacteria bacterium]